MKLSDYYKEFSSTIIKRKMKYCNNNVIPLLKERKIKWDYTPMRIKFCGKTFPMKNIDNGEAEKFILSLIDEDNQSKLELYEI